MSTVTAITRSYRAPRQVLQGFKSAGADSGTALTWLFVACILFFVARLPELARTAHFSDGEQPLLSLALPIFFGTVLLAPIFFMVIAWIAQQVSRLLGGQGDAVHARLALFWSLLAITPLVLLQGLLSGLNGPTPAGAIVGYVTFAVFLFIWINGVIALDREGAT